MGGASNFDDPSDDFDDPTRESDASATSGSMYGSEMMNSTLNHSVRRGPGTGGGRELSTASHSTLGVSTITANSFMSGASSLPPL